MAKIKRTETLIAVIGLIGVLSTALISNWDKLFKDAGQVTATYTNYIPTDDFETEMRHFWEISGARSHTEDKMTHLVNSLKERFAVEYPDNKNLQKAMGEYLDNFFIEIVDMSFRMELPIYKSHYTLKEVQEMNKFYSTEIMKTVVLKSKLIVKESLKLSNDLTEKIVKRLENETEQIIAEYE